MTENEEFLKKMENLNVPEINPREHPKMVKMAILNADRSAALGVWLIILPCYFLCCVCMYYFFNAKAGWFGSMFALVTNLDKTRGLDLLAPFIFLIMPVVCIIINMLAIIHVGYRKIDPDNNRVRELNVTIKIKFWNIALILLSVAVLLAFLGFAMTESVSVKN
ncbi:MAG TPA: hypothetical protein VHA56_06465 [Mucilaginibacter sp.]|nr:hypothetical protein [Mucilaginibacter sp.]